MNLIVKAWMEMRLWPQDEAALGAMYICSLQDSVYDFQNSGTALTMLHLSLRLLQIA